MKKATVFNRSLLSLSLGCALAALPLAVRAQDAPAATTTTEEAAAPTPATDATPAGQTTVSSTAGKTLPKVAAGEKFDASDKVIARKFANGNEGEIEMAKLALTNAESQDIKDFAQKMIDAHGAANKELIEIANAHGMDLKPELTQEEHAAFNKMKQAKGTAFDGVYAKHAVYDHTEDVAEYKKDVKKIKDKALLGYAEKTLPIVEEHLTMAKGLTGKASVGGEIETAKKAKKS